MKNTEKVVTEAKYDCEPDVLYDAARLGWDHYDAIQPQFELKSGIFTKELSVNARKAIDEAEAMPENAARQLAAKNALSEMRKLNPLVTGEWQVLEFYIRKAYPNTADAELDAAGYKHFTEAIKDQWGNTESLVKVAKKYMAANSAKLLEGKNMPEGFPAAFGTLGDEFIAQRNIRLVALGTSETGTTEKIVANNAVYDQLLMMLEMGKLLSRNNATEYKKFVFDNLKNTVRGRKPAGAKGMVKADESFRPIANATLTARNLNPDAPQRAYSTTTAADGKFFLEMASGNYEITVAAEDFANMVVAKFKVSIGTKSRLNPVLAPASVAATSLADAVQAMGEPVAAAPKKEVAVVGNGVA
jgi:Carboxypeptidase regulatory-like domain